MNKSIFLVLGILIVLAMSVMTIKDVKAVEGVIDQEFLMNFTHALNGSSKGNSGTFYLYATTNKSITNMSFYYKLDTATTWTLIGNNKSNMTSVPGNMSILWSTSSLTDGNYTINATGYNNINTSNSTYWTTSLQITNINIDNTKPAISYGSSCPTNGDTVYTSTTTLNTTSDVSIKSCDFYYRTGAASVYTQEAITGANLCSKTLTNSQAGEVYYYWVVSDGYNNTDFVVLPRMYKYSSGGAPIMSGTGGGAATTTTSTTGNGGALATVGTETGTGTQIPWIGVVVLVLIIGVIWWSSKKRR